MEGLDLSSRLLGTPVAGKRVFLTGHTGFEGSCMTALLKRLGCDVYGYALPPKGNRACSNWRRRANYSPGKRLRTSAILLNSWSHCASHNPALVIHMAAQAFVRRSYAEPVEDVGFGIGRRVRSAN